MLNLGKFYGGSRPQQGSGFETFSWYYFRISGVILFVLLIIHLIVMHVPCGDSLTGCYSRSHSHTA
jgi:succinate dehydrogenase hydrophobic anchor subunit